MRPIQFILLLPLVAINAMGGVFEEAHKVGLEQFESSFLAKLPRVRRHGESLTINTSSGPVVFIDNNVDGEGYARYRLAGYFERARTTDYLILASGYEGHGFDLVNSQNGKKAALPGEPIPSPRHDFYLAYSIDLDVGAGENRIVIVNARDYSIELDINFDEQGERSGPASATWVDNEKVLMVKQVAGYGRKDHFERILLKRTGRKWTQEAVK